MPRKLITLTILVATMAACTPTDTVIDIVQAEQLAEQVRSGCVATHLEFVTQVVETMSPLCEARDMDHFLALATGIGCSVLPGVERQVLQCDGYLLGEELVNLRVELEFVNAEGDAMPPGEHAIMRINIDAIGLAVEITGTVVCTPDPARGLVLGGSTETLFLDGCTVTTELLDVTALRVADIDETARLVFTSGSVDIEVHDSNDVIIASGSAALVGRTALIVLQVDGVFSQGEIALGQ